MAPVDPPHSRNRTPPGAWRTWALLIVCLAVCAAPPLAGHSMRDSNHSMESIAVATSQEAWLRWHAGEPRAWLVTTNDGLLRVQKPPMVSWVNFLAWSGCDPATTSPVELIRLARFAAVVMGMVFLASIFWLGVQMLNARLAALATLVAGSMVFVQRQAQTASFDMHFTAWVTLAVAGAAWAIDLTHGLHRRDRAWLGWSLCALATAAAGLSKNPLAFPLVIGPTLAMILWQPHSRGRHVIGLAFSQAVAAVPVCAWYWYVRTAYPEVVGVLELEFTQPRPNDSQPFWYYLALLGLVAPWTIWLVGALLHPWGERMRIVRPRIGPMFAWFVFLFLLFSIPEAKQQRYILPIIAPVALLIAWLWHDEDDSVRMPGVAAPRCWPIHLHWVLLLAMTACFGACFIAPAEMAALRDRFQQWMIGRGWGRAFLGRLLEVEEWEPVNATAFMQRGTAIGLALILLTIVVLGWRWQARGKWWRACMATALWAMIVSTVFWRWYGSLPSGALPERVQAEALVATVGPSPVYSLRLPEEESQSRRAPSRNLRLYFGRLIPHVSPIDLEKLTSEAHGPVYVLAFPANRYDQVLKRAGFTFVRPIEQGRGSVQNLWVREPPSARSVVPAKGGKTDQEVQG